MKRRLLAVAAVAASVGAAEYQDAWGPPVGSALPSIDAQDQASGSRDLANLSGTRGLLIFQVRSADW